jgi:hypothetical protein
MKRSPEMREFYRAVYRVTSSAVSIALCGGYFLVFVFWAFSEYVWPAGQELSGTARYLYIVASVFLIVLGLRLVRRLAMAISGASNIKKWADE